ncbi:calcium/sodium antiporter [Candidatus Endowatersipora endosymbiont of Watersipora subatra]|uniref:calcium/sodium antiporter n=1 Tax=Candidatus Endowatersipora endosymbiont of Watersipora subatra TaxID=3077946 RepID=UPI00312C9D3C
MVSYLMFIVGLFLLLFGGDWLVKGSIALAEKLDIPTLIIGITIVALGTSAPELLISLQAALSGFGGLAVGNVVGSNIANILMVLAVPALISPISCKEKNLSFSLFFLALVTIFFMIQIYFSPISRLDGILLFISLAVFLSIQFYKMKTHQNDKDIEYFYREEIGRIPTSGWAVAKLIIIGMIALPLGSHLMVDAASDIAKQWNVSETIIGITIIAIGTSLPELMTSLMAARYKNASVAIGNVVGSNIFNITGIMGLTAIMAPISADNRILSFDMWVMLATTLFLITTSVLGFVLERRLGAILLVSYCFYIAGIIFL